jgi:succinate-semialdehyde dehydrogenase/glutarate-semialdehyde dehydrogenase
MEYQSINPATGELLQSFEILSETHLTATVNSLTAGFKQWRQVNYAQRSEALQGLADLLSAESERCAVMISTEMGKPLEESKAEMKKCIALCRYYAALEEALPADKQISVGSSSAVVRAYPLGVVLGIMPWNFPFWQALRFAIPTIMAGNTVLLKHAPNVPQCALLIDELIKKANFPAVVYENVFASHEQIERVLANPHVAGVSLTGSITAGASVASIAAKHMKKIVLELGGNDPFVVFEDANLPAALRALMLSRARNAGQSCVAAKRVFIQEEVYAPFKQMLVLAFSQLKVGDAFSGADIGPLARLDLAEKARKQVEQAVSLGATVIAEINEVPKTSACYFKPCVLEVLGDNRVIEEEEIFAPVFTIIPFKDEASLLQRLNSGEYGLGASIWTKTESRKTSIAESLESGMIYFNEMVYSDPAVPFGGIKHSGMGHELGELGMHEFIYYKTLFNK